MRGTAPNSLQYAPNVLKQVPPQMVSSTTTSTTTPSGVVDPYVRPMAVRDLADALPRSVVVKATIVPGNHGYGRQALPQNVLQTNSFMRPRSASLVPLEAVMGRKEGTVPRQGSYQNDGARPGGQVTQVNGVRGGPSQFRYSTRSLSTQWLNGLAQTGLAQSGSAQSGVNGAKRCVVPNSPGQVLAGYSSGQVIQVRYGAIAGYLANGTPVGVSGVANSGVRESNFSANGATAANRSLSTGADHGFGGLEHQIQGVASRWEFDDPYQSDTFSLCSQHSNRMGRFDDAPNLRTSALQQGVPTRGTSSLSTMVTQTGATTSLHNFSDSMPDNFRNCASESTNELGQVRKQLKVDMGMVSALVEKMRNVSIEPPSCADAIPGNTRNHFEPRVQLRKHGSSLVDVPKEAQRTLENSGSRTKLTAHSTNPTIGTNPTKPQPGVANKPPSGASERPVIGLGPRNQLISQEKLKKMPVTNTLTGSPFPSKPLTIQDLGHISNPRPLPPAPQRQSTSGISTDKATHPSSQKQKTVVENGSRSSSYVEAVEEESLLGK